MKKKIIKISLLILILVLIILGVLCIIDHVRMKNNQEVVFSTWGKKYTAPKKESKGIKVALTLHDEISKDTVWCGTFQLIWNDLKNELAKQDIVFDPQLQVVENLNKGTFTSSDISEDSYYKIYGIPTLELKEEIENAIKQKFNETSDILNDFEWENHNTEDYFLYAMLKKEFKFEKKFNELEKANFGEYKNVQYFGINEDTRDEIRNQVKVLYYKSSEEFAIKLITKENDEIIIAKGIEGTTFYEIYQNIIYKNSTYEGSESFGKKDTLKIPNIEFKVKEEFEEIQDKTFKFKNGTEYCIDKALQTIEFELDKTGGKIKSEAGMMNLMKSDIGEREEIRNFNVNNTFTIFLQEEGKSLPYFAGRIDDISKFQSSNTKIEKD